MRSTVVNTESVRYVRAMAKKHLGIRVDESILARIEVVRLRWSSDRVAVASGAQEYSTSDTARSLILRGLEVTESEHGRDADATVRPKRSRRGSK